MKIRLSNGAAVARMPADLMDKKNLDVEPGGLRVERHLLPQGLSEGGSGLVRNQHNARACVAGDS